MTERLRVAMAQINLLVGDVAGNARQMLECAARARDELGANLVVFPELALTGYPPDDLLLREDFLTAVGQGLDELCAGLGGITAIVGAPKLGEQGLQNAAYVIADGAITGVYSKQCLPAYGVFDDRRHFVAGDEPLVVEVGACRLGITICEDAWHPQPVAAAMRAGAEVIVNINASPFDRYKRPAREATLRERTAETGLPILYCNMAGGQDEVVYDGGSCALDAAGALCMRAPSFATGLYSVYLTPHSASWAVADGSVAEDASEEALVYEALVWGVRDYIDKNGFPGVVIGLSGGMDSALTACIAVDALGAERVRCIMMPTRYTSDASHRDAAAVAGRLGVGYDTLVIEPIFEAFMEALAPALGDTEPDITEENLQSRARGTVLMAVSNKTGSIVLATGNKSELAVGYATLYGDMVGGFSPLKDIFKTEVYRLARYRNKLAAVLPEGIFDKAPTAELRPDQKDSDSLPDYALLDRILAAYVEADRSVDAIACLGIERATVQRVVRMIHRNEYKRRQAAPGVKVTERAFGRDRRYPITSGFGG